MRSIFTYTSYRDFLKDYYQEKKKANPSYSFRFFAKKAQLNSGNYLKLVMDGKRGLTHRTVLKFTKGLALNEWEALFFENLVFYNQSKDESEGAFYLRNMELAKAQDDRALLSKDQYEVLANWYPLAIKELSLVPEFQLSSRWIAARLEHKITPQQAKEAIDLLERLGLVEVDHKNGKLRATQQSLQSPDLDRAAPIAKFHREVTKLALASIDDQQVNERCLSALTVAIRQKDLPEAFRKIHKFRNEMDSFLMKGKPYDSVYQLNIHFFRVDNDV